MNKALKTAMTTSISEVFETMFFLPLEVIDPVTDGLEEAARTGGMAVCRITFAGSLAGSFFLLVPDGLLSSLTSDFMGIEAEDVTQEQAMGTIREAVNMIAGNTFTHFDDAVEFQLGIPEMVPDGQAIEALDLSGQERIAVGARTGHGDIRLFAVLNS